LNDNATYSIYGLETGETGTEHYQGYCYFKQPITFKRITEILPRAHVEKQRGTCEDAILYCKKDGNFTEYGTKPDRGGGNTQRDKWLRIVAMGKSGDWETLEEEFPSESVRFKNAIRSLRIRPTFTIDGDLENEWWCGPTGSGKSRRLWNEYPLHYNKPLNKWWDGYVDQDVVSIEEWSPKNECTASNLKIWADRYPFTGEIKGGSLQRIRPKKIIVLSNYSIEQCFTAEEDILPLKRRFKVIRFEPFFG